MRTINLIQAQILALRNSKFIQVKCNQNNEQNRKEKVNEIQYACQLPALISLSSRANFNGEIYQDTDDDDHDDDDNDHDFGM